MSQNQRANAAMSDTIYEDGTPRVGHACQDPGMFVYYSHQRPSVMGPTSTFHVDHTSVRHACTCLQLLPNILFLGENKLDGMHERDLYISINDMRTMHMLG